MVRIVWDVRIVDVRYRQLKQTALWPDLVGLFLLHILMFMISCSDPSYKNMGVTSMAAISLG